MKKIKEIIQYLFAHLNKYGVTLVVAGVIILFLDDNNVMKRIRLSIEASKLKKEIRHYEAVRDSSAEKVKHLNAKDEELEKIAREDYLMKKDNEEIFIIGNDK